MVYPGRDRKGILIVIMDIIWFQQAKEDLAIIRDYISKDNPVMAKQIIFKITISSKKLSSNPGIGRPGRVRSTRELVLSEVSYIIAYRVKDSVVEIIRVLHQARVWPKHL